MFNSKRQFRTCLLCILFLITSTNSNAQIVTPAENEGRVFYGKASFYGFEFAGNRTANGEIFRPAQMTAAHRYWPFHTLVKVTNLNNSRSVIVRINDRGPFIEGRHIDVSRGVAEVLGFVRAGVADVRMEVISWGKNDPEMFVKMNEAQNSMLLSNNEYRTSTKPRKNVVKPRIEATNSPEFAWNIVRNKPNTSSTHTKIYETKPDSEKIKAFAKLIEDKVENKVVEVVAVEKTPTLLNIAETIVFHKTIPTNRIVIENKETTWNIGETNILLYNEDHLPILSKPETDKIVAFAKNIEKKNQSKIVTSNSISETKVNKPIIKAETLPTTKKIKETTTNDKQNEGATQLVYKTPVETKVNKPISSEKPAEITEAKTKNDSKNTPLEMKRSRWMCMENDTLSGWCIQIGAFALKSNAVMTYDKVLELTNDWVCIQEIDRSDMPLYRVIASKTMDYNSCKANLEIIRTVYPEAFITSYVNLRLTANK